MVRIAGWKRPAIFFLKVKNKIPKYVNDLMVISNEVSPSRIKSRIVRAKIPFKSVDMYFFVVIFQTHHNGSNMRGAGC